MTKHFGFTHLSVGDLLQAKIESGSEKGYATSIISSFKWNVCSSASFYIIVCIYYNKMLPPFLSFAVLTLTVVLEQWFKSEEGRKISPLWGHCFSFCNRRCREGKMRNFLSMASHVMKKIAQLLKTLYTPAILFLILLVTSIASISVSSNYFKLLVYSNHDF